jgi:hypothetical protein
MYGPLGGIFVVGSGALRCLLEAMFVVLAPETLVDRHWTGARVARGPDPPSAAMPDAPNRRRPS